MKQRSFVIPFQQRPYGPKHPGSGAESLSPTYYSSGWNQVQTSRKTFKRPSRWTLDLAGNDPAWTKTSREWYSLFRCHQCIAYCCRVSPGWNQVVDLQKTFKLNSRPCWQRSRLTKTSREWYFLFRCHQCSMWLSFTKISRRELFSFAPIFLRSNYFRQNIWGLSSAQFHFWYIFKDKLNNEYGQLEMGNLQQNQLQFG